MLYGLMFDHLSFSPFSVTVWCVRSKASVRPHVSNDVVMHVAVKGGVFEFIGLVHTKNYILLCESCQKWFEFVTMYKTRMPHANVINKVWWEGIELCKIFRGTRLKLGEWKIQGWEGGVAWVREDVLGPGSFQSWYGGDMQLWIYQIGPTWTWRSEDHALMFWTGKLSCYKGISYVT